MPPSIIVSGALANKPFSGGNAWSRLGWILGFRKLGFDVCFVEEIGAAACVDSHGQAASFETSVNLAYFRMTMKQFGLAQNSALIFEGGRKTHGLTVATLAAAAARGAIFNMGGHLRHSEILSRAARKIYYDDDPGFTQFWHAAGTPPPGISSHDVYFTIGENIGSAECTIPSNGIEWRHTRPPVNFDEWPVSSRPFDRFTTVASWRGTYGPVEFAGRTYGIKAHEFRKFVELPLRTDLDFEIALQIDPADRSDINSLASNRWRIADPRRAAGTPDDFRQYLQTSGAEFSAAQNIYVDTQSGWFSDRTVRYLASGRPALVQDTGFGRNYRVGAGLLTFRTLDEAVDGARRIVRDYNEHAAAARRVAAEFFDARHVVGKLAVDAGLELPASVSDRTYKA